MFSPEGFCSKAKLELVESHGDRAVLLCPADRLESTLIYLKNHESFTFFVGASFERKEGMAYYWIEKIDNGFCLGIKCELHEGHPSVSSIYPIAAKYEALSFERGDAHFKKELEASLFKRDGLALPYQSVEVSRFNETKLLSPKISGPFSPMGEKSLEVKCLDMSVVESRFRVGARRRFSEALVGMRPWKAADALLKMGGAESFLWSSLFFRALEFGNEVSAPDKALAVRMIFQEFGRALSHIEFCANLAMQMQANELYFKSLRWCQLCMDLMSNYSGNSLSLGILTYGGVHREPPANWFAHCMNQLARTQTEMKKEISNISQSRFWKKTEALAILDKAELFKWSLAGSALRASGVNYDMRKTRSYDLYKEVDFDVPIGVKGALFDRALVRLSEAVESIGIINQLLDNLPTGNVVSNDVGHFSNIKDPSARRQEYTAAANREWNIEDKFYHASLESAHGICLLSFRIENGLVSSAHLGAPDINILSCLEEDVLLGQRLEDIGLVMASLPFNQKSVETF